MPSVAANTTNGDIISLESVSLKLKAGDRWIDILKNLDLQLAKGRTLSIVGPSGSGKTTLLMVMAGLQKADEGLVMVAGKDLSGMGEDDLARLRRREISIIFQGFHLVPTMTALENVALPLEFAGRPNSGRLAADALAAVGLSDRMSHYPSQLSGGEQQRVAIARSFAPRPSILLADEPTGNLDGDTGAMIAELLFSLQKEHDASMVLVTHDQALAAGCHRSLRMRGGRLHEESGR